MKAGKSEANSAQRHDKGSGAPPITSFGNPLRRGLFPGEIGIDRGDHVQRQPSGENHAAHHGDAHRHTARARAVPQRNRQDAEYRRQARHQNRTEPGRRSALDGFHHGKPGLLALVGKFHDQDAVLGHQSDEHDLADLAE
jgi:hypothetical protein